MSDKDQTIIGLCQVGSPALFVKALKEKIANTYLPDGTKAIVKTVDFEWQNPNSDASKLVRDGDFKIRAFEEVSRLRAAGAKVAAVTNCRTLGFKNELQEEITTPITDFPTACAHAVSENPNLKLGYLGSTSAPKAAAIKEAVEKVFKPQWVDLDKSFDPIVEEIQELLHKGKSSDEKEAIDKLAMLCSELVRGGAEKIFPTCGLQALLSEALNAKGYPVIDVVKAFADYLCFTEWHNLPKPFKIGIVGGLGPAATVDLYDKITRFTPAKTDQKHIKVAVEQNPQVPDRTKYLLEGGVDPTLALYQACKRLENDDVDAIVIACNTAHAYFETILPHLSVPLINMQQVTLEEIIEKYGKNTVVGLMATDGTIQTGIYSNKAKSMNLSMVTPDKEYQALVMEAIYGELGAKAGYTEGHCKEVLLKAAHHLAKEKGATVLVLGCTELPLILDETDSLDLGDCSAAVIDPTSSLSRRVVKVAEEIIKIRGRR